MSLQAGLYSMLTWSSLVLFIMALTHHSHVPAEYSTYVVLGGLPFAFAAGALAAWGRMLYAHKVAQRFHNAKAANLLRVRHRFWDAQEVEVTARWGSKRQWLPHKMCILSTFFCICTPLVWLSATQAAWSPTHSCSI